MATCFRCGQENPEGFRFCGSCGASLEPVSVPRETRKTVTVVFSDVTGSTALGERLDPESLRRVMGRYFDEMKSVVEAHEGTVEKFIGDAVMAVFGIPIVHEDDALRAVRAAAEMRDRLGALNEQLEQDWGVRIEVRTGVNTGEVVAGDARGGQRFATGDAVNVAKRFEEAAPPGEILLGEATYHLVRDAVEVEQLDDLALKGKQAPVHAYRLLSLDPGAAGRARRLDSPMVGRDRERTALHQAYERAAGERACHLFTVLGAAGVGKSRLVSEFLDGLGELATVVHGRCLPYGEGITFWPLREVIRTLFDEDFPSTIRARLAGDENAELIAERLGAALGHVESIGPTDETSWAVRKLFEALARERPLIVVFDDLQWGAPTFLDLVEHIADWSREAPILLVCLARPDLLDGRPRWSGGKFNATSVLLEPLNEAESGELVGNLLGRAQLAGDVRARVMNAAEGNPLFVEEMLAMLIDDGLLERSNGDWAPTGDLETFTVPPTIQALLSARLDQLGPIERSVSERASIEGKVFHRGAVVELSSEEIRSEVGTHLEALVRKELVRPDHAQFPGEDAFRFRHQLIRDAAYDAMSKELRAELHEQFAAWLESAAGDRVLEYEEILGFHLEQAHRYRTELAPADEAARDLASRAAERLSSAGVHARLRGDMAAAADLLDRAVSLLPNDDARRRGLFPALLDATIEAGQLSRASLAVTEALELARITDDRHLGAYALLANVTLAAQTDPEYDFEQAKVATQQAIDVFEDVGDDSGVAEAYLLLGKFSSWLGRSAAADEAFAKAVAHSRRAGDRRAESRSLAWLGVALPHGNLPARVAIDRANEILENAADDRTVRATVLACRAHLFALQRRFDEARRDLATGRDLHQELGAMLDWSGTASAGATINLLAGDPVAAEDLLRMALEALHEMGETGYTSTLQGMLGQALYAQERYDDAYEATERSERAAARDDIDSQVRWRCVRAKLLARQGESSAAETMAREAKKRVKDTDMVDLYGDALTDLAEVYGMAGRSEEQTACLNDALSVYEARENLAGADRARSLLDAAQRS